MKTVYLQKETDIVEVLEKIDKIEDKEITIVVPLEHKQFEKEIVYEILRYFEKNKNRKFIISSNNKKVINYAKKYGFEIASSHDKFENYIKEIFHSKSKVKREEIKEKEEKDQKKRRETVYFTVEKKSFPYWLLIFLILIFVGVYLLGIFVINKAEVDIVLERGSKNFSYEFYIESDVVRSSSDNLTLKGIFVNEIKNVFNSYPVKNLTEIETKAGGKVKILNKGSEFILIPNTRFVSEDGKVYRTKERLKIPGGTPDSPAIVEIEVFAQESGAEYNIQPTKFKIPGLSGTEIEKKIEVFSEKPFSGGGKNLIKVPTLEEYNFAQREFDSNAREYVENYLKNNYKNIYFPEGSKIVYVTIEKIEPQDLRDIRESIEEIKIYGNAKIVALGYREEDLLDLIKDLEIKMIKEGYQIDKVEIKKTDLKEINLSKGKGKILVEGSISVKPIFNELDFKNSIASRDLKEIYDILKTKEGIKEVKLTVWPFWVKKVPDDLNKIKLNLR